MIRWFCIRVRSQSLFRLSRIALLLWSGTVFLCLCPQSYGAPEDPLRGYISVEPYELRLSALIRPGVYRQVWRMRSDVIGPSEKEEILSNVMTLFSSGVNVSSGENRFEFTSSRVQFVRPDPDRGYVNDDREEIPIEEALIGISTSSIAEGVRELDIEWLWYPPGQRQVAIEITGGEKPAARYVTLEKQATSWSSARAPQAGGLMVTPIAEKISQKYLPKVLYGGLAILGFAALVIIGKKSDSPGWVGWLIVAGIACCVLSFRLAGSSTKMPDQKGAGELMYRLLNNTYHAFDFRDESQIYDVLQKSISGPLLEEVYLEFMRSLELEDQGGPRVRVLGLEVRKCELESSFPKNGFFRVNTQWISVGEVSHWGHTHLRNNLYEAMIEISALGDRWKISGIRLLNEERLLQQTRRTMTQTSAQ